MASLQQLLPYRESMAGSFETVSFEGGFLFVRHKGRAIEASVHEDHWWMEFWEASDDEYADPVRQADVASADQVIQEVIAWLQRS